LQKLKACLPEPKENVGAITCPSLLGAPKMKPTDEVDTEVLTLGNVGATVDWVVSTLSGVNIGGFSMFLNNRAKI